MTDLNIVILTGAGISAESGIRTFRDTGGLWEEHDIYEVATPEGYAANPELVQRFYSDRRLALDDVSPNAAHYALARLEAKAKGNVTVVTQNVDDLHERAGSHNLIHMHGELKKVRCQVCGTVHDWAEACFEATPCPTCGSHGPGLRPHIVWFGEIPFEMDRIGALLAECDLFLSIGTSGQVYPAAGFVAEVRRIGRARTAEINLEPSDGSTLFHESLNGKAGDLVPDFVDQLLKEAPND